MMIQASERMWQEVYKVAAAKAGNEGGRLRAADVFAAVRQILPGEEVSKQPDVVLFETLIRTINGLSDTQLKQPEIDAIVTALKRWKDLTKTSPEIQAAVRSVASKFFYVPRPPNLT
jgi:hypothetical protein